MKRMLINATQEEELRVAMVDGQRLYDLNIEGPASERKKANIYKGTITRIEPSLEAAFVDYGADRHGFLPLKEISPEYFVSEPKGGKTNIKDVLKEGQDIVVQIDKEERGNKGAALTTYVSLAGRFIVLKPNKARSGGVSRRIVGDERDNAREALDEVEVPQGMSVILRTAGIDRNAEELKWDLDNLLQVWQAILNVVVQRPSPFLIYRESNAVLRALRDYLTNEIGEILIDDEATYEEARQFVEQIMPHNLRKLKLYSDPVPLFTRFQIESQIESAFAHGVSLPSGGSVVIDHTEALVSIDINSARATKGGDIEATALNTNLEAADEIARQLRLRDLGGLVVIDFIDMSSQKNQRDVENRLREAVRQDRARVQIGKISRFGLLEMSRQRLRPSLGESSYLTCPRCSGIGTIRSVESLALAILRIIGEEARKERTAKVIAQLPVEVATYLLNEKRDWVQNVEARHNTQVVLVANAALETPHYEVRRVRDDQTELPENAGASYQLAQAETEGELPESLKERPPVEQAAVGSISPATPAPVRPAEPTESFWSKLVGWFRGDGEEKPKKAKKKASRSAKRGRPAESTERRDGGQRGRRRGGQQDEGKRPRRQRSRKKTAGKKRDEAQAGGGEQGQAPQAKAGGDDSREEQKRTRSRRSRGGRRRRRGSERQDQDQDQPAKQARGSGQDKGESKPESKAEPMPDPRPAARSRGKDEPKAEPMPDPKPASAPEPKAEKRPDAGRESGPEPRSQAKAEPKPEPKPEQKPEPKPERAERRAGAEHAASPREPAKEPGGKPQQSGGEGDGNGSKQSKGEPGGKLLPWEPIAPPSSDRSPPKPNEPAEKASGE